MRRAAIGVPEVGCVMAQSAANSIAWHWLLAKPDTHINAHCMPKLAFVVCVARHASTENIGSERAPDAFASMNKLCTAIGADNLMPIVDLT